MNSVMFEPAAKVPGDVDATWRAYSNGHSAEFRERLIVHYAPLVRWVVGRMSVYTGGSILDYEDLLSYGIMGLIEAIERFEPAKGIKFETYASLRIRGAVLDNLRTLDWIPRTVRQLSKQVEREYAALELELGREPSDTELSQALGIEAGELGLYLQKASLQSLVSLDEHTGAKEGFPHSKEPDPQQVFDIKEQQEILEEHIAQLNKKQQLVLSLYYFEGLTLKEISDVMGVTQSRVSQIHNKALLRLSNRLGRYKAILFDS